MIVDKLFRHAGNGQTSRRATIMLWILGAMLLCALFIRAQSWLFPEPPKPLLTPADGLVQSATADALEEKIGQDIPEPLDTLGASVWVVGYYSQNTPSISSGSSVVVLVRDGWRFAELLYEPGVTLDVAKQIYEDEPWETIEINGQPGMMVNLSSLSLRCIEGKDGVPGQCQLTRVVVIPLGNGVLTVASDGNHATPGELIALAQATAFEPTNNP